MGCCWSKCCRGQQNRNQSSSKAITASIPADNTSMADDRTVSKSSGSPSIDSANPRRFMDPNVENAILEGDRASMNASDGAHSSSPGTGRTSSILVDSDGDAIQSSQYGDNMSVKRERSASNSSSCSWTTPKRRNNPISFQRRTPNIFADEDLAPSTHHRSGKFLYSNDRNGPSSPSTGLHLSGSYSLSSCIDPPPAAPLSPVKTSPSGYRTSTNYSTHGNKSNVENENVVATEAVMRAVVPSLTLGSPHPSLESHSRSSLAFDDGVGSAESASSLLSNSVSSPSLKQVHIVLRDNSAKVIIDSAIADSIFEARLLASLEMKPGVAPSWDAHPFLKHHLAKDTDMQWKHNENTSAPHYGSHRLEMEKALYHSEENLVEFVGDEKEHSLSAVRIGNGELAPTFIDSYCSDPGIEKSSGSMNGTSWKKRCHEAIPQRDFCSKGNSSNERFSSYEVQEYGDAAPVKKRCPLEATEPMAYSSSPCPILTPNHAGRGDLSPLLFEIDDDDDNDSVVESGLDTIDRSNILDANSTVACDAVKDEVWRIEDDESEEEYEESDYYGKTTNKGHLLDEFFPVVADACPTHREDPDAALVLDELKVVTPRPETDLNEAIENGSLPASPSSSPVSRLGGSSMFPRLTYNEDETSIYFTDDVWFGSEGASKLMEAEKKHGFYDATESNTRTPLEQARQSQLAAITDLSAAYHAYHHWNMNVPLGQRPRTITRNPPRRERSPRILASLTPSTRLRAVTTFTRYARRPKN